MAAAAVPCSAAAVPDVEVIKTGAAEEETETVTPTGVEDGGTDNVGTEDVVVEDVVAEKNVVDNEVEDVVWQEDAVENVVAEDVVVEDIRTDDEDIKMLDVGTEEGEDVETENEEVGTEEEEEDIGTNGAGNDRVQFFTSSILLSGKLSIVMTQVCMTVPVGESID